jgi:hypothetical protein
VIRHDTPRKLDATLILAAVGYVVVREHLCFDRSLDGASGGQDKHR